MLLGAWLCLALAALPLPADLSLLEYVKDAVRLVASREMHVCATFARRFYWSDLNLWPEDLAPGSVVLLSGQVGRQSVCLGFGGSGLTELRVGTVLGRGVECAVFVCWLASAIGWCRVVVGDIAHSGRC